MVVSRFLLACALAVPLSLSATASVPVAVSNDNRTPAGQLSNGVLTVHLDMRSADWFPNGVDKDDKAVPIYAFAEEGKPAQDPGPLIRIEEGTQIHAIVRNSLKVPITVHGLHTRPGKMDDTFKLEPGATHDVSFLAGAPGTYYYWGTESKIPPPLRISEETELTGAFIVDRRGSHTADRIFVINMWFTNFFQSDFREAVGINGRSWPDTEHLTVTAGEPVHWRIINPTSAKHAMHLHGFFYSVTGMGDAEQFKEFEPGDDQRVVTQGIEPSQTFNMTWVPERPGNWIFHCHMTVHMGGSAEVLHGPQSTAAVYTPAVDNGIAVHAGMKGAGMHGIVLGVTVLPSQSTSASPKLISERIPRRIHLYAGMRAAQPYVPAGPSFYFEGERSKATNVGPPIILTRGEPTEITVTNELPEITAVHWHGIELESYYDGVPGWGGNSAQITSAIAPGESFVAHMTPPRAGTYIYHTHWHDVGQLTGGLYGPLLVLEPGEQFDPATDKTFVFGRGGVNEWTAPLLINGSSQPVPILLKPGTKYRFRFINITTNDVELSVELSHDGKPARWRAISKDGAELPATQAIVKEARQDVTVGETRDFEFTPEGMGTYELKASAGFPAPLVATQTMFAPPPLPSR